MNSSKTLVVLLGPTAVGKTDLSLELAKLWSCPIISADSRQIYKGIPIGTASPTERELKLVKHYFVNTLELESYYSAALYEKDSLEVLTRTFTQNDKAILSGGSMMYIDALCKGIDDIPTVRDNIREEMQLRYKQEGLESLCKQLEQLDPYYYAQMDSQNPKRVIHALEICLQTGVPYSSFRKNNFKKRPFNIVKIGLYRKRSILFDRINQRVDQMMANGLLEEVQRVYPLRHLNSLNTVGYKELFEVISGHWPLDMAIERIKKNTRVYAKKQMTWFKKDPDVFWINLDENPQDKVVEVITSILSLSHLNKDEATIQRDLYRLKVW